MAIDILFLLAMIMAIFKGYTKGFIIGLFSFIGYFIGLAAALKLSTIVAQHIAGKEGQPSIWLPVFSFLLVFIAVVIAVNLLARLIRGALKLTALGWLDRLTGVVLFIIIYLFIFSILLFYAVKISIFQQPALSASHVYPYISPVAPHMVNFLGKILPIFKNMFLELQDFFSAAGENYKAFLFLLNY